MYRIRTLFCFFLFVTVGFAQSRSPIMQRSIGQLLANGARIDGVLVPSGTALYSPTVLKTDARPAVVRLNSGDLLHLAANSSALFQTAENGDLAVVINSGTLSFKAANGATMSAASPATLTFSQQRRTGTPVSASVTAGVVAVLMQPVSKGALELLVNDASRFNPDARTMIRRLDGTIFEIHYLKQISGNRLLLKKPLGYDFQAEDTVLQGCVCDEAIGAPADGIVGNLVEPAAKGEKTLKINTVGFFDPEAPTVIKRKDGGIQEVHGILSISGNTVLLKEALKFAFLPGDVLVQGCSVPPLSALQAANWALSKSFVAGTLAGVAGGTGVAYVAGAGDGDPTREECSKCLELYCPTCR